VSISARTYPLSPEFYKCENLLQVQEESLMKTAKEIKYPVEIMTQG